MINNDYNSHLLISEASGAFNDKNDAVISPAPIMTHMIVDIADILRAYSDGMREAFNMGKKAGENFNSNTLSINGKEVL